jgi:hypothetical protein
MFVEQENECYWPHEKSDTKRKDNIAHIPCRYGDDARDDEGWRDKEMG